MNIKVTGRAVVLTSIDAKIIEKLAKFQPDALIMKNEEGDPIFKVAVDKVGSITKYGVSFNDRASDGKACLTVVLPTDVKTEARGEYVKENFGPILWKLQAMEAHLIAEFDVLAQSFSSIDSSITVE